MFSVVKDFIFLSSAVHLREISESDDGEVVNLILREAPFPVSSERAREVHSGFTAKAEDVLERIDGEICDGHGGEPDEIPVDILSADPHVFSHEVFSKSVAFA